MKVAIYGAGAMGTVLGAYITQKGYEIDLITRNKEHVQALQENGATVKGTIHFHQKVTAYLPEAMKEQYDIILLMTKQRHNKEIVTFLHDYLSENGILCTMQNGIPEPLVASIVGEDRTAGCAMSWGATFHGKGVVELTSEPTRDTLTFSIGKYGDVNQAYFDHIVQLLDTMGTVHVEDNFIGARWAKLLVNAAFSGLSVVTGETFGRLSTNRTSRKLALSAIKECIDVANASGITIEPIQGNNVEKLMDYNNWFKRQISLLIIPVAMRKHKHIRSSMLRDLERGFNTEIEAINGVVKAYGNKYDVPTPINNTIIDIVHRIEAKELVPSWNNLKLFKKTKQS